MQCPKCKQPFAVGKLPAEAATAEENRTRTQPGSPPAPQRRQPPAAVSRPSRRDPDEPSPVRRKRPPQEDEATFEEVADSDGDVVIEEVGPADSDEVVVRRRPQRSSQENRAKKRAGGGDEGDSDDEPPRRRRRTKRRPVQRRSADDEGEGSSSTLWWVGGSGFVVLTLATLLGIAVFAPLDSLLKIGAIYLLVSLPIGTVVFFIAMFLSSVLLGALDIGELHVAAFKAYILVFLANLVSLVPILGWGLPLLVWLIGSMTLFRLDFWEARMLIFINWLLNLGLRFLLFMAVMSWIMHGGAVVGGSEPDQPPGGDNVPQQHDTWDESDIQDREGTVEYDRTRRDAAVVIGISFRQTQIEDADLAHMKDFPQLRRLDLTGTHVTDQGLKHLHACPQLQRLVLTGTQVTDAGIADLQQALPRLQIERL
jgi:hypothetical protein